ncbi:sensor histidine kinase [Paenibacillus eucommiae]|uniref:histidine kinase n=1 Tax=Paenibacillus eucommiae TaxID=1355755 RepID=A0ABS4JA74_9BACL|nr:histidine kinase [Paenibacillus eucommiae]MBP1995996.1 two-component system sensor histidine kinase YesM [Paenibacillus eucommiae]
MTLPDQFSVQAYKWFHLLKIKLIAVLLLSSMIPLLLIGFISYFSFYSLVDSKIQNGILHNLKQVRFSLENMFSNLNHVSQQLAFDGRVGRTIYDYLTNDNLYEKKSRAQEIEDELNLIGSTNPNIGLLFYYFADTKEFMFQNYQVRPGFEMSKLPVFSNFYGITYHGPHQTMNNQDDHYVLSISREMNVAGLDRLYIYMESNNKFTGAIFHDAQYGMKAAHLLIDNKGKIAYSEIPDDFPVGMDYVSQFGTGVTAKSKGYYHFNDQGNQGWKIAVVIPENIYDREMRSFFLKYMLLACGALLFSLLLSWIIWRTVYRPLKRMRKEIQMMANSQFHSPLKLTRVLEFDLLLNQFHEMRQKTWNLITSIEEKEQAKARLEVEKMRMQINPHFVHNTLDTVRWLARMNGQDEIDRLISSLNKVIYYNLGKEEMVTIREELEALQDYVMLQGIRYNFRFDIHIRAADHVLETRIPRFILQPLVENALYHGIGDDGIIEIEVVHEENARVSIQISDNGAGMTEAEISRVFDTENQERKSIGMGIGIAYVLHMLKYRYGDDARLQVMSEAGSGTKINLQLPIGHKELNKHESIDR